MRIEDGKLVLETRKCSACNGSLRLNDWVDCSACKGTGKKDPTKLHGRNCQVCAKHSSYAKGKVLAIDIKDCHCTTTATPGYQPENLCDAAPDWIWQGYEFRVYRSNRHQTIGEYLLGHGCAWSTTDYGRHKRLTDEQLIEDCRKHTYIQAIKFTQKDGTLAEHIGIFCNDNGYSVKAVFGDPQKVESDFKRGLDVETGFAVGESLAPQGLNGTILVSEYKK